jgi:hypothetical protein
VFLVGGLTPRYLVDAKPPAVPAHAGTRDVDVVIDLQILANTEAYHTLEENLKKMGFERAENDKGQKLSWRWQARTDHGAQVVLELLADAPNLAGGKVRPLPTEGTISALNIPHSSIVFDMHRVIEIEAELLGGNGIATEKIRYANLVSFTCLKVFAFDDRFERKDARFSTSEEIQGYRKDGPVAVAKFELGESEEPALREARALRQREASDVIDQLLARIA